MLLWGAFGEQWALNHKVTFDGEARQIYIAPSISSISVKDDIYSSWKEWLRLYDNSKYLPAFRTVGGDPIGGGKYAGDIYFLVNNWKLIIDHSVSIEGVIFSDDFPSPFEQTSGTQIVTNVVSSLVTAIDVGGGSATTAIQIREEMDANSTRLAAIASGVSDMPNAIRDELTPELAHILTLQNNPGLTVSQATMLTELYVLMGLDPTKPLIVNQNSRLAGDITQNIQTNTTQTIVNRV